MSRITYERLLCWFTIVTLFSNLSLYLFAVGATPLPPLLPMLVLAVLALPLVLQRGRLAALLSTPLFAWTCGYLVLSVFGYFVSSHSAIAWQGLRTRVLSCLQLVIFLLLLGDRCSAATMRRGILLCALVFGVGLNLYEVAVPLTFSGILGRSAGLYLNPNISAMVLATTGLLTIESLPERARPWFVLCLTVGITTTLSRSSMLGWVAMLPLLSVTGVVSSRGLFVAFVAAAAVAGTALIPTGLLAAGWDLYRSSSVGRFAAPFDAGAGLDVSAVERLQAFSAALAAFAEHPLAGAGVGATVEWAYATGPHNMYALLLAEHGLIGGLLYPAAILLAALHSLEPRRSVALCVLFLLWCGLFSHNMLESTPLLLLLALMGRREVVAGPLRRPYDLGCDPVPSVQSST